jgi:hypothetical protein
MMNTYINGFDCRCTIRIACFAACCGSVDAGVYTGVVFGEFIAFENRPGWRFNKTDLVKRYNGSRQFGLSNFVYINYGRSAWQMVHHPQ